MRNPRVQFHSRSLASPSPRMVDTCFFLEGPYCLPGVYKVRPSPFGLRAGLWGGDCTLAFCAHFASKCTFCTYFDFQSLFSFFFVIPSNLTSQIGVPNWRPESQKIVGFFKEKSIIPAFCLHIIFKVPLTKNSEKCQNWGKRIPVNLN